MISVLSLMIWIGGHEIITNNISNKEGLCEGNKNQMF